MIGMGALAVFAAVGAIALAGTKTGLALALLAVLGPIAFYSAIITPIVFPFMLFVLLVPFDNLLGFSSFGTVTKLVSIVSAAAIAVWLLRTQRAASPGRSLAAWGALVLWIIISLLWAMDPELAVQRIATPLQLFGLYAICSLVPIRVPMLRWLIVATIVSGAFAGLYGAYVFHSGVDVSTNQRLFLQNDDTLIDPNNFAAALLMPFSLAVGMIVSSRNWLMRLGAAGAVASIAIGVAVSGSRGALLAIAVTFVYLVWRSRNRLMIAFMGIGGVAVALAMFSTVLGRFSTAVSSGGAGRADIWKVGIAAFKEHWLVGAGWGNFPLAFDQAFLNVTESYYTHWHRVSHNVLVGTSVELGIVGLVLLLGGWWYQFRALHFIPADNPLFSLRTALEAGVAGLFVAGFFLDIMTEKYLWLAFILVALTRNAARATQTQERPRVPATQTSAPRSWRFG